MNKFTRSQMGKIMAYALSAAMAVTVVPTYMMKPLVAEAAVTGTVGTLVQGETVELAGATSASAKLGVFAPDADGSKTASDAIAVFDANSDSKYTIDTTNIPVETDYKLVESSDGETFNCSNAESQKLTVIERGAISGATSNTAVTTSDTLTVNVPFANTTNVYYKISTSRTPISDMSDSTEKAVTNKQITTDAVGSLTAGQTYYVHVSSVQSGAATFVSQPFTMATTSNSATAATLVSKQGVVLDAATLGVTAPSNGSVIGLFAKDTDLSNASKLLAPVYEIKASQNEATGAYEYVVPYSIAAGTYFVAEKSGSTYTQTPQIDKSVTVTAATPVTGLSLSATDSNINYNATSGNVANSNTETVTIDLSGDEKTKNYKAIYVNDNELSTYSDGVVSGAFEVKADGTKLKVKMLSVPATASAKKLNLKVDVYTANRKTPISRTITLTAVDDMKDIEKVTLSADNSVVLPKTDVKITTAVTPANSTENIKYSLVGTTYSTSVSGDEGVLKLKDDDDNVVATFDTATGVLNALKADEYKVSAQNNAGDLSTTDSVTATVKVVELGIPTILGTVGDRTGSLTVDPSVNNVFASYSVADPEIATVTGATRTISAKLLKPGITEITGKVTIYDDKAYDFTTKGYIVVAPENTEDFVLTDIDNTETYVNELGSYLVDDIAKQLSDAILDGKVDSSKLSLSAYSAAEASLISDTSNYYVVENEDSVGATRVTATGLLFNAYDEDVVSVDDPDKYVEVGLTVSDLQAKDEKFKVKDSLVNFVAEATVDSDVVDVNAPVWLTVENSAFTANSKYTVYDDGKEIFTAKCTENGKLTFQTDSFSVFSIVKAADDAKVTDNTAGLDKDDTDDTTEDIYDLVNFSAHVQRRIGTDDEADIAATVSDDGIISLGTHGQSRRVEKITLTGLEADEVEMTAHVQKRVDHPEDVADLTQVVNEDGSISIGTEHQSRRIEAFSMNLKGDLAEKYDVYYRVHAQNYGWLGWAKNGEIAGTSGHSFRLEGIEIIFVEKGTEFDESQYVKTPEEGDRGYSEKAAYMDRVVSDK